MSDSERMTHLADGDGLEIAHPEDFGVQRDDTGELSAIAQRIPGTDKAVRVKPLVGGAVERWEDVLDESNPDDERVDAFLREYVSEGIGAEGLDEVPDYLVPAIIEAVKRSSGYEVFQHLQQAQEERNLQAFEKMDNVPTDLLMKVMNMDEDEMEQIRNE